MTKGLSLQRETFAANRADGRVELEVALREGATRRTRVYEKGSLRVRFPAAEDDDLEAVLVNTAGGIAGGDTSAIDVSVGDGASLRISTSSAEKVYRSHEAVASMNVRLRVGKNASLAWMPRETILFDRARLTRTIDIDLTEGSRMLLAEAVVFGRSGMQEKIDEGWFSDRWRVRRDGRLIYADTTKLDGAIADKLREPAVAARGIAIAVILLTPADDAFVTALRGCQEQLMGEVGASSWNGITAVRFCAPDGEALRHDLMTALGIALMGPLPPLWVN